MKQMLGVFGRVWIGLVVLALAAPAAAQTAETMPAGSKLFIEKMDADLDGFLRAEIMKKKVPVSLVLTVDAADFVMTGNSSDRKSAWHEGWLSTQKDNATGSVMIFAKESKQLVWAEEAGDRSLWLGAFARGGPRKVASRIADRLNDYVKKQKKQK